MKFAFLAAALLVSAVAAPAAAQLIQIQAQAPAYDSAIIQNGQRATLRSITPQTRMAARALGFGGFAHYAVLPGLRAMLRLTDRQPTFVVAAPDNIQPQGLFTVASFEPRRNNTREVLIGGGYASYSSGIHPDRIVQVDMREAPDQRGAPAGHILYHIRPLTPLPSGEYALIVAMSQQGGGLFSPAGLTGTFYDFGVD